MSKTFDPAKDIPDLSGKVILVTGGNAGLGSATVRALAARNPSCTYLCARKVSDGEEVVKSIRDEHPKANIVVLQLDLSSFDSIKKCAADFNSRSDRLDLLFLNAGISGLPPGTTKEGYEIQFGVNHIGHALLTQLLMPTLLRTTRQIKDSDIRIIVVSSIGGHRFLPKEGLNFNVLKTDGSSIDTMLRYGQSKLANMLFAKKLSQLYPSITSTSLHPGTVTTDIWGKATAAKWRIILLWPIIWLTGVGTDEGAKTQLWCATAATGKGGVESGKFYVPIGVEKENHKISGDQQLADELWRWTSQELAMHGSPGWPEE